MQETHFLGRRKAQNGQPHRTLGLEDHDNLSRLGWPVVSFPLSQEWELWIFPVVLWLKGAQPPPFSLFPLYIFLASFSVGPWLSLFEIPRAFHFLRESLWLVWLITVIIAWSEDSSVLTGQLLIGQSWDMCECPVQPAVAGKVGSYGTELGHLSPGSAWPNFLSEGLCPWTRLHKACQMKFMVII